MEVQNKKKVTERGQPETAKNMVLVRTTTNDDVLQICTVVMINYNSALRYCNLHVMLFKWHLPTGDMHFLTFRFAFYLSGKTTSFFFKVTQVARNAISTIATILSH